MSDSVQKYIRGRTALEIKSSIERAIHDGRMPVGCRLPTVRALSEALSVSPGTTANAYRSLREAGLVVADGRRGTFVAPRPFATLPTRVAVTEGSRRLDDGNPDAALLPDLARLMKSLDVSPCLYGVEAANRDFAATMLAEFADIGVAVGGRGSGWGVTRERRNLSRGASDDGPIAVVSGAMDGIDRLLVASCRRGDRVAVEDPGFPGVFDIIATQGLVPVPMAIDDQGPRPDEMERALRAGVKACIVTPRAQSPFGAAITPGRARALKRVLQPYPEVLVIEDDHASLIAGVDYAPIHTPRRRWAYVHSFSKAINPDLRVAVVTGDPETIGRVAHRQAVAERWVSHILQRLVCAVMRDQTTRRRIDKASDVYLKRREALMRALEGAGFSPNGASGYNVWLPVAEETTAVQTIAESGWAVAAGERFRLSSSPGLRITAATLEPRSARGLADVCSERIGRRIEV